jgi:hypothetical protein
MELVKAWLFQKGTKPIGLRPVKTARYRSSVRAALEKTHMCKGMGIRNVLKHREGGAAK